MGFERFVDNQTNQPFYYNKKTGETRWEKKSKNKDKSVEKGVQYSDIESGYPNDDDESNVEGLELTELALKPNTSSPSSSSSSSSNSPLTYDSDVALLTLASPNLSNNTNANSNQTNSSGIQVIIKDEVIIKSFPCLVCFHSCCCEGPTAVLEGILKTLVYLALSLLLLPFALLLSLLMSTSELHLTAFSYFREGLLFLSATATLILPFALTLTTYSKFSSTTDWYLSPIPTFLGYVDPRRFYTIESGDGSMAINCSYKPGTVSMDTWKALDGCNGVLHPPGGTYDSLKAWMFGGEVEEREHVEVVLGREVRVARAAIRREVEIVEQGFVRTKT